MRMFRAVLFGDFFNGLQNPISRLPNSAVRRVFAHYRRRWYQPGLPIYQAVEIGLSVPRLVRGPPERGSR